MFKPSSSEHKKYIWTFYVRTNLNRVKQLIIVSPLENINSRCDIMAKYLIISRYGIPCYLFSDDADNEPATLTNSNDKTLYGKEYCYVDSQITDKIYSIRPTEYIPKPPAFNINAPEFIPKFAKVNVQTSVTKNTVTQPYASEIQSSYSPQHPHLQKITMRQPKQTIPLKQVPNAPEFQFRDIFIPSKPDIYQTETTQFNMQYF